MLKFFIYTLAIVVVLCFPLLLIWSLQTLFPLAGVTYGLEEWLAAFVLLLFFNSSVSKK